MLYEVITQISDIRTVAEARAIPTKEDIAETFRTAKIIKNFLPKVNRVIKLPSSMMSASWMGSHFTNADLRNNFV